MARILISTPPLSGALAALEGHELITGSPGSDACAEALICPPTVTVGAAELSRMQKLRVISLAGGGTDALDPVAIEARGIALLTAGEALIDTTADLAFGLIISASRLMHDAEQRLRDGRWEGWRFDDVAGIDINGATLGLVGFGAIGQAVARRAQGFGMQILHHTRHDTAERGWQRSLDELLGASDIVSLRVPLSDSTRGLIDRRRIGLMKQDAVLVNTARGAVLDEQALAEALESGRLLAAGLDVYEHEPRVSARLLAAPRTVLLPHLGSATERTRRAMLRTAAERLAAFLAGI